MQCSKCGATIPDGATICNVCGEAIEPQAENTTPEETKKDELKDSAFQQEEKEDAQTVNEEEPKAQEANDNLNPVEEPSAEVPVMDAVSPIAPEFDPNAMTNESQVSGSENIFPQGYTGGVNPNYGYNGQPYSGQQAVNGYNNQGYQGQQQYTQGGYNGQPYGGQGGYNSQPYQQQNMKAKAPAKPKKPLNKKLILGIGIPVAVIIIALVGLLIFLKNKKTTVDLSKYVKVTYTGYDTAGTVAVEFDYDKFNDDYDDIIERQSGRGERGMDDCEEMIRDCVNDITCSKEEGLSNGDTITIKFDLSESKAENRYKVKFKADKMESEVKGLDAVNKIDPFENAEMTFSGIAPDGSASFKGNPELDDYYVYYELSKSYGLDIGDKITVTIDEDEDYLLEYYGLVLTETTKEYTVDKLDKYMTSMDELTDDNLTDMKKAAETTIGDSTEYWEDTKALKGSEYKGMYFGTRKAKDSYKSENLIFLVYEISVSIDDPDNGVSQDAKYYFVVEYSCAKVLADGTTEVDVEYPYNYNSNFSINADSDDGYSTSYWFSGYEDMDTVEEKVKTNNSADYTFETDIK